MSALRRAVLGAVCLTTLVAGAPHVDARRSVTQGTTDPPPTTELQIVGQQFNIGADEPLTLTLAGVVAGSVLRVGVAPVDDVTHLVGTAPAGTRPTVPSDTVQVDAAATVSVPTQSSGDGADTLTLTPGTVYRVTVSSGHDRQAVTYVNATDPDDAEAPLPVAVLVGAATSVTVGDDGSARLDAASTTAVDDLLALLDTVAVPVTVRLSAGTITALVGDSSRLAGLADALSAHELLSEPILPLDPSVPGNADLYTAWLRRGEDQVSRLLRLPGRRLVAVGRTTITADGAALLRNLGTRLVVVDAQGGNAGEDLALPAAAAGQPFAVQLPVGGGNSLDALLPDPDIAAVLAERDAPPVPSAARIAAHLLLTRRALLAGEHQPDRAAVIVATSDLTLPAPATLTELTLLLADTPGVRAVQIDDIVGRVDPLTIDAQPVTVELGAVDPAVATRATRRATQIDRLVGSAGDVASMLPATDPRPVAWLQRLDALHSTAVPDDQSERMLASVAAEQLQITGAVSPPAPFNATINSRRATLRLNFTNHADVPLRVRVRFTAGGDKARFPDNDTVYDLAPNGVTEIAFPMEARSNGRIPLLAEVLTPSGSRPVSAALPLTLTINAISGLGYLLSGAAALMLAAWWWRHIRRAAAARRTATTLPAHD